MMTRTKIIGWVITGAVVALSFLKDEITPDYLNTPRAYFLDPVLMKEVPVFSFAAYPVFWTLAILYSTLFVVLPALALRLLFNKETARYALFILVGVLLLEYGLVLSGQPMLLKVVLPKVNRYFHSPIILLFLIAAFRLNKSQNGLDR